MQVVSEIHGLEAVRFGLTRLQEKFTRLEPLWERLGKERYAEEKRLFDAAPWPALTPAYAKRKAQLFGDKSILRATDRLFRSLTEEGAPDNIHRVRALDAEFGSSVFYGLFHVPKRDPMAEPDVDRYQSLAEEYMNEMIREAGFN